MLPVMIQIHDYARVPAESLSLARATVTRLYERIGVRTEWIGAERRGMPQSPDETPRVPVAQLTIIVLTPAMAARAQVRTDALGFAAVTSSGMGRIGYVIYDRVRSTAADSAMNDGDLLGFVMAHELGHLLLPHGPQPPAGVMKEHWDIPGFRRLDLKTV